MSTYRITVAYAQMDLAPLGVSPVLDPAQPSDLAQVGDGGRSLIVLTGISMGPVTVEVIDVDTLAAPPLRASGDDGDWENELTLDMDITEPLFLSSPTLNDGPFEAVYMPSHPGAHGVTVRARGRASRPDDTLEPTDPPCEDYQLLIRRLQD